MGEKTYPAPLQTARAALIFTAERSGKEWGSVFPRNRGTVHKYLITHPDVAKKINMRELRQFRWTPQQWKALMDLRPKRENPLKEQVAEIEALKQENDRLQSELEKLQLAYDEMEKS